MHVKLTLKSQHLKHNHKIFRHLTSKDPKSIKEHSLIWCFNQVLVSSPKKKRCMLTKNTSQKMRKTRKSSQKYWKFCPQSKNYLKTVHELKPNQLASHNLSKKQEWHERTKTNTKKYFHLLGLKDMSQPLSFKLILAVGWKAFC